MCTPLSLTTVFTPPASCNERLFSLEGGGLAIRPYTGRYSACYPSSLAALDFGYDQHNGNGLCSAGYRPGVCPESWTVAHIGYGDYSVSVPGVTPTSFCCPNSMTFDSDAVGCQTAVSTSTSVLTGPSGGPLTTTTFSGTLTLIDFYVPIGGNAQAALNQPSSTAAHTSPQARGSASNPPTSMSTKTLANGNTVVTTVTATVDTANAMGSGLSSNAIAGIATSITIIGLAIIVGIIFFLLRKRRQKNRANHQNGDPSELSAEKRDMPRITTSVEIDGNARSELSGGAGIRPELPGSKVAQAKELGTGNMKPAELEGSGVSGQTPIKQL